jgi:hypothetical protein
MFLWQLRGDLEAEPESEITVAQDKASNIMQQEY